MEKGPKPQHKKKFDSPVGGKRLHKASILPRFQVNLKDPDNSGRKTKHGPRKTGSKLQFQMGGDSTDPLNLNSLIDRDPSEVTPQCSPYIDRVKELSPQVVIARDVTDPLNLKCNVYEDLKGVVIVTPGKKKRKRRRNDSGCFEDEEDGKKVIYQEDVISPKIKRKYKHPKQKNVKEMKEKKKTLKEKSKLEKIPHKTSESKPDETSQEEKTIAENKTKELIAEGEKLNTRKEIEETPTVSEKTEKPKTEVKSDQKVGSGKRKHQKTFLYGNYNRYYGYRNPKVPNDPRLKLFQRKWFEDKTVLDIGCNIGNVTLEIAQDFAPKHVLGIDIDSSLIRAANRYLRCAIQEHISKKPTLQTDFPVSFMVCHGPIVSRTSPTEGKSGFPYNVHFKEENFVLQNDNALAKHKPTYDVILCLSLTKWIHLNWGDEGLKRSFRRMFLMLNPGGRLLLEAQPFNSYARKKNLSEKIRRNYDSIQFKPNYFVDYLMSEEVGFASYEALGVAENASKGFQRPVYVFTKSVRANEKNIVLGNCDEH